MKPLFRTLHPAFFYGIMLIYFVLSFYFISHSYQPIYTNYALATFLKTPPNKTDITSIWVDCGCEKRFKTPYPIVWSGKVFATFVSGEDIGVKRYNQNTKYKQFYVIGNNNKFDLGNNVRVQGKLIGITCAYANTIFGECVGEVEAEKITAIKID
ncbi:MAG: hypothetical protein ABIA02_02320 [Candidatus Falkowbacteria bacterium]